jgi:secernin
VCDLLCALPVATDGPALFAKNSDRPPDEPQVFELHPPRTEARTRATHVELAGHPSATRAVFGSRPTWGWGLEQGVNDAGVAAGNATIYTTLDPRSAPDGLTGMDLVRLVLERCDRAADGVALIERLLLEVGQGGSGHAEGRRPYWSSFLLADPTEAFVVETSGSEVAAEGVADVRATSNRTTIPAFDAAHRHPRQPVATLVDPRLAASRAALAARPVTVASLQAHLASHEGGADGWTVCMHVDGADHREATTAAMVAELPAGSGPIVHHLVGSPCTGTWETYGF